MFSSTRDGGVFNLWEQLADGTGSPSRLTTAKNPQNATGVAPDGTVLSDENVPAKGSRFDADLR